MSQVNDDPTARSQQPSPTVLMSLGIRVRDFAYENTLPAIIPVPRVPRQVQPAAPRKRSQRDWDDNPPSARSLERKLTEPALEPTRTLERRITVKRVCSIIIPRSPHPRFSTSPPTSPLTPQDSFVVHMDDPTSLYTKFTLPVSSPPPPLLESPSPNKEPRVRKPRRRGIPVTTTRAPYQLRQRPTSLARRTR